MGHVRVTAEYGTATVWLDFPGAPVNALDRARLAELDAALAAVAADPFANIVVLRSARPAGFCAGLRPGLGLDHPTDRAAFADFAQRVADRLANLPQTTVAFLDGPVLGAGLELALACDHRLVLSRITTHLGFAGVSCFTCLGGAARLRRLVGKRVAEELLASGRTLSGREAVRVGLADHAFCERRGKIELRTFLDALERRGPRPRVPVELSGLAAERRAFAAAPPVAAPPALPTSRNPLPPFPDAIGLLTADADAVRFAAEAALRGGRVVVGTDRAAVDAAIAAARARGFATPLEAEQATARVTAGAFDRAGLLLTDGAVPAVGRRCVVAVLANGRRQPAGGDSRRVLGLRFAPATVLPFPDTDPDAVAALAAWLAASGRPPHVVPAPRPVAVRPRRATTIPA